MRSILAGLRTLVLPWGSGPGTARIVIGPDLPPPLDTYLFAGTTLATAGMIYWSGTPSNDDFQFWVLVEFAGQHVIYQGAVLNGAVLEYATGLPAGQSWDFSGGGVVATVIRSFLTIRGDFQIDDWSAPRGYREGNATNGGTLVTTAAEAAVPAATWDEEPTIDFEPDRLYRITVDCAVFNSAATNSIARVRVRQGSASVAGTLLGFWQLTTTTANVNTSTPASFTVGTYVTNATGATVSTKLSLTIERLSGAANLSLYADSTVPTVVAVEDIGSVADQPGLAEFARSVT